jgi:hypothetical protein
MFATALYPTGTYRHSSANESTNPLASSYDRKVRHVNRIAIITYIFIIVETYYFSRARNFCFTVRFVLFSSVPVQHLLIAPYFIGSNGQIYIHGLPPGRQLSK